MRLLRRRRAGLTRQESLATVPVPNRNVETAEDDAGNVTITIPWRPGRLATALAALMLVKKGRRRRVVELDEVGSSVYRLCDGNRSIKSIVDIFAGRYKLSRKEAALAITTYLNQLARRGIVAFWVPEAKRSDRSGEARQRTRKGR